MEKLRGDRVQWLPKQIKLFTDGAVYSQLMQLKDGYLDGHKGEWIQSPEDFASSAWAFWKEGYQIVVHQNGDMGMEVCVNTLEGLLHAPAPLRPPLRHPPLRHLRGAAGQARGGNWGRSSAPTPSISTSWANSTGKVGVGPERAEVMARGRTVLDSGTRLSFHSDAPMAPARPMTLVWAAANRIGLSGKKVLGRAGEGHRGGGHACRDHRRGARPTHGERDGQHRDREEGELHGL